MASADAQVSISSSPRPEERPSDLDRLEGAIRALIQQQATLREQNAELRSSVEAAEQSVRRFEGRLLAENQLRQDALKRIDDLVGLIEQLEPELAGARKIAAEAPESVPNVTKAESAASADAAE